MNLRKDIVEKSEKSSRQHRCSDPGVLPRVDEKSTNSPVQLSLENGFRESSNKMFHRKLLVELPSPSRFSPNRSPIRTQDREMMPLLDLRFMQNPLLEESSSPPGRYASPHRQSRSPTRLPVLRGGGAGRKASDVSNTAPAWQESPSHNPPHGNLSPHQRVNRPHHLPPQSKGTKGVSCSNSAGQNYAPAVFSPTAAPTPSKRQGKHQLPSFLSSPSRPTSYRRCRDHSAKISSDVEDLQGSDAPCKSAPLPINVGQYPSMHTYGWKLDEDLAGWFKEVQQKKKQLKTLHRKAEAKSDMRVHIKIDAHRNQDRKRQALAESERFKRKEAESRMKGMATNEEMNLMARRDPQKL